jgi:hypothetical protein
LPATDATVIETVGEGRWITFGDQVFMGGLATPEQQQNTQQSRTPPHRTLPRRFSADRESLEGDSLVGCERKIKDRSLRQLLQEKCIPTVGAPQAAIF